jgi:signal transduction histidine kinase
VPANLFEKIFEPFYSTHQDGAGLGLAVVKNLMEACGGSVSCQKSSSLGGMRFTLRFQAKTPVLPVVLPGELSESNHRENLVQSRSASN